MDWDIRERYRSTILLAGLLFTSSAFLAFHKREPIRFLQVFLRHFALPPQKFLIKLSTSVSPAELAPDHPSIDLDAAERSSRLETLYPAELQRKMQMLAEENRKLREILNLQADRWPKALPAHVVGRDPQRWFQDIVLDKGTEDGLAVDDPVLAIEDGREALIGRISEASGRVSKVMLLQDPLSAVAAEVLGVAGEDGVVEGTNSHALLLKYLDRGSQVKIGDLVVTSGLGKMFPAKVPIGWVKELEPDPRQLFLQAHLRPAVKSSALRNVLVIMLPRAEP